MSQKAISLNSKLELFVLKNCHNDRAAYIINLPSSSPPVQCCVMLSNMPPTHAAFQKQYVTLHRTS